MFGTFKCTILGSEKPALRLLFGVLDCFTTLFSIVWLWFEMPILFSAPVDSGTVQLHFDDKFLDLSSGYRKCNLSDCGQQRQLFCKAFFSKQGTRSFEPQSSMKTSAPSLGALPSELPRSCWHSAPDIRIEMRHEELSLQEDHSITAGLPVTGIPL